MVFSPVTTEKWAKQKLNWVQLSWGRNNSFAVVCWLIDKSSSLCFPSIMSSTMTESPRPTPNDRWLRRDKSQHRFFHSHRNELWKSSSEVMLLHADDSLRFGFLFHIWRGLNLNATMLSLNDSTHFDTIYFESQIGNQACKQQIAYVFQLHHHPVPVFNSLTLILFHLRSINCFVISLRVANFVISRTYETYLVRSVWCAKVGHRVKKIVISCKEKNDFVSSDPSGGKSRCCITFMV